MKFHIRYILCIKVLFPIVHTCFKFLTPNQVSTVQYMSTCHALGWHHFPPPIPQSPQSPIPRILGTVPFLLSMSALITPNTIGSSQWIIGQASWVELCLKSMTRRWAWMWHSLRTQPWACHYGNNSFQGILNLRDCRTSSQCSSSNTGGKW